VRIFGASAPKTGLSASIFFAARGKKGFPLQSLAPHGLAMAFNLLIDLCENGRWRGTGMAEDDDMEKIRVLIIDDLPFMRTAIRAVLEEAGMEVAGEAENGREGVSLYMQCQPDIVLLDIVMPVMDGITALQKLIRQDPLARIIMCSALGEQELIVRAIQMGARDFIVKPFQPQRIVSAIRKAVKNSFSGVSSSRPPSGVSSSGVFSSEASPSGASPSEASPPAVEQAPPSE
jgi:two-component system chemotaxis response regulator CheY